MEARRARGEEGHVVVIGRAAHEGDDVLRAVRELHAEHARVEVDLAVDVGSEEQHVAEPTRGDRRGHAPARLVTACRGA